MTLGVPGRERRGCPRPGEPKGPSGPPGLHGGQGSGRLTATRWRHLLRGAGHAACAWPGALGNRSRKPRGWSSRGNPHLQALEGGRVSPLEPGAPSGRDLPCTHPEGTALPGTSLLSTPVARLWSPLGGSVQCPQQRGPGTPPTHPVPLPATRWGALQQTQLWPLLAGRSAPTLGAHTFPGPSPPDSPSGAAWTPPPPGSPPPVTPGPRTCPAVCVLPQPAFLPAALGGGPLGPLRWAFLPLRVAPPSEPCYPALPPSVRPEFYVLWWERVSVGLPGEEQGPPECGVAVPQE